MSAGEKSKMMHGRLCALDFGGRVMLAAACLSLAAAFAPAASAQEYVGLVLKVSGTWVVNLHGLENGVEAGQGLRPGSLVRPASSSAEIVILLNNDRVVTCTDQDLADCERPFAAPRKLGLIGRFWRAVRYLVGKQPNGASETFSRGGSPALREAVVGLRGGRVDLRIVFAGMSPGDYFLRFEPANPASGAVGSGDFRFTWRPPGPAPVTVPGLAPGLYKLLELEAEGRLPSGNAAWVLVAPREKEALLMARFRQAVRWTKRWNHDPESAAARAFLRVYLESLSRPQRGRRGA